MAQKERRHLLYFEQLLNGRSFEMTNFSSHVHLNWKPPQAEVYYRLKTV